MSETTHPCLPRRIVRTAWWTAGLVVVNAAIIVVLLVVLNWFVHKAGTALVGQVKRPLRRGLAPAAVRAQEPPVASPVPAPQG